MMIGNYVMPRNRIGIATGLWQKPKGNGIADPRRQKKKYFKRSCHMCCRYCQGNCCIRVTEMLVMPALPFNVDAGVESERFFRRLPTHVGRQKLAEKNARSCCCC
jgi:hypothetical protein